MAGRLHKPKAKSFWILVRRLLLLRRNRKPPAANPAAEEEKSGLLSRRSLEDLLLKDGACPEDDAAGRCPPSGCDKKHSQVLRTAGLHRPGTVRSQPAGGGRDAHRRFMFGGFRRRLLMRRQWRPVLVAIPE